VSHLVCHLHDRDESRYGALLWEGNQSTGHRILVRIATGTRWTWILSGPQTVQVAHLDRTAEPATTSLVVLADEGGKKEGCARRIKR
jgi:hypothetical protein